MGVSLFPWLKQGVNNQIVKIVTNSIEDDESDDDDLQEDTYQML